MGKFQQSKNASITEPAKEAIANGWRVYVCRFWDEVITYQGTGPMWNLADVIQTVENEGWQLDHMAYSWVEAKSRGLTLLVFKLPGQTRVTKVGSSTGTPSY